nr:hypothetical protein [Tanacetum cinerariifolium]
MSNDNNAKDEMRSDTNSPINKEHELKIGGEFLKILRDNAFNGTDGGETDKNTQNGLWKFYVNERTKGTIGDLDEEPRNESYKKTCSDTFYKPYLDAQEAKDIYELIDSEYSSIPIPARRDINNPDELCRTEEFTVVRHLIGTREEFITDCSYLGLRMKNCLGLKNDMPPRNK